jgi:uncharacterized protein with PQ loop repeat
MLPTIVAVLAPLVNSVQLIPQLHKTYVTKKVKHLSYYSLIIILCADILWILHGHFNLDYSLIIASVVNLLVIILLLIMHYRYR